MTQAQAQHGTVLIKPSPQPQPEVRVLDVDIRDHLGRRVGPPRTGSGDVVSNEEVAANCGSGASGLGQ